ncbi:ABC transporter permease [Antribacter gilvus]|uniref:ABC transporter permease n=1 Tax=Antribacter gilvus TaxID=2304675 RepID=UPI000F79F85B|nr:ABC transporter permease [Antribacter gilvus]
MSAPSTPAPARVLAATGGGLWRIVLALLLPAVLVTVWWFASADSTDPQVPPLATVLDKFPTVWFAGDDLGSSLFVETVGQSVSRVLIGYAIAMVIGIVLGVLIGTFRPLRDFCEPVLEFFRAIPPPILTPILMLFMGIDHALKISLIVVGALWPILLNTIEGVRGIDPVLKDTARAYGLGPVRRLFSLTLPGASPQIYTGGRQALSIALIMMVIGEMFAAFDGIGSAIAQFQATFSTASMWSAVLILGCIGSVLALIFGAVERVGLTWYRGYLRSQRGGA